MQRIPKPVPEKIYSIGTKVPTVVLYRDDVERIIEMIHAHHADVRIKDDDNFYDSLDEIIPVKGNTVRRLSILSEDNSISLVLKEKGFRIYAAGRHNVDDIYPAISKLLEKRRSVFAKILSANVLSSVLILMLGIGGTIMGMKDDHFRNIIINYYIVGGIFAAGAMFLATKVVEGRWSKIHLTRQHETRNFWRDNRDTIIVGLITGTFAAFVTYLFTREK